MFIKKIIFILILQFSLYASEYALVVNQHTAIEKLSLKQIKDIFMMKKHFVNDIKVIPVNITASLKLRTIFEKEVLRVNRNKLNSYWVKKHFQGIRPPVVQSSLNSMKLFIKNVDGSMGYLPLSAIDSDLKVIYEF